MGAYQQKTGRIISKKNLRFYYTRKSKKGYLKVLSCYSTDCDFNLKIFTDTENIAYYEISEQKIHDCLPNATKIGNENKSKKIRTGIEGTANLTPVQIRNNLEDEGVICNVRQIYNNKIL